MFDQGSGTLLFVVLELVPELLLLPPRQWQPCCLEALSFERDLAFVMMAVFAGHVAPRNAVAVRVETARSVRSRRSLA